jgi:hypothetical protein
MDNIGQIPLPIEKISLQCSARVRSILEGRHGQTQGIKSKRLTFLVFGQYNHNLERAVQNAITDINNNDGGLICSDTVHGYWWADSLNDGLPAAERRVSRALTQLHNAKILKENIRRHFGGQMEMSK